MGRRRNRSRNRRRRAGGGETQAAPDAARNRLPDEGATRRLPTPWRERLQHTLEAVRRFAASEHAAVLHQAVPALLADDATAADRERATDDVILSAGALSDGRSIAAAFVDSDRTLEPLEREQVRRWPQERRRAVLVVQRAGRDQLSLWDPLEGAPLSLHLLERLSAGRAAAIARGSVLTVTYQPWMARLVAVGTLELFQGREPLELFRREVVSSGAAWHELPPRPPTRR